MTDKGNQDDVYQFPDQEDRSEYKPKGMVTDMVRDAVSGSFMAKVFNKRLVGWLVVVFVVVMIAMNFRLFLSWTHSGIKSAHSGAKAGTQAVASRVQKLPKVSSQKKPTQTMKKPLNNSKAEVMKLLDAKSSNLPSPPSQENTHPPLAITRPSSNTTLPVQPPVVAQMEATSSPTAPGPTKAQRLLEQVNALDTKPPASVQKTLVEKTASQDSTVHESHDKPINNSIKTLSDRVENMQQQQVRFHDNMTAIVGQLKSVQSSLDGLEKAHKASNAPTVKATTKRAKQAVAVEKKVAKPDVVNAKKKEKVAPVVLHYRIIALVYGRAWIEEQDSKKVLSVRVGDDIPGMKGRVKSIYLDDYMIETTQGEHIYDHFEK